MVGCRCESGNARAPDLNRLMVAADESDRARAGICVGSAVHRACLARASATKHAVGPSLIALDIARMDDQAV
jgi:hypothetical protein